MVKKQALSKCFAVLVAGFILLSPISTLTVRAQDDVAPETVTIAGTLQSELGCSGDWMPGCELSYLTYNTNSDVWSGSFNVTPGNDQDKNGPRYKAALNGSSAAFTVPGITTAVFVVERTETPEPVGATGKVPGTSILVALGVGAFLIIAAVLYYAIIKKKKTVNKI